MKITLNVKEVTVLTKLAGQDEIHIELDEPTTHPVMNYPVMAKIFASAGYGLVWCREILGVKDPKVIEVGSRDYCKVS